MNIGIVRVLSRWGWVIQTLPGRAFTSRPFRAGHGRSYGANQWYSMKYTITPVTETYSHKGKVQRAMARC